MLEGAALAAGPHGPYAPRYGDSYHGPLGALQQARQVFLAGSRLHALWAGQRLCTVLETGFGLGFNFLATWQAWQQDPDRSERLHYLAIERHPVALRDLAQAHAAEPELAACARALRLQLPPALAGVHRLAFADGRVQLTLVYGDGVAALEMLDGCADVLFLDGFAPDRNPELWSPELIRAVARLLRPGAHFATWCAAGSVRRSLQAAGFQVERVAGRAGKREQLRGTLRPDARQPDVSQPETWQPATRPAVAATRHVLILGAGLAGCQLAHALTLRGWQVQLIDAASGPAQAASGNPSGVLRPLWARDDPPLVRLARSAFLHAVRTLGARDGQGAQPAWHASGVLQLARDPEQLAQWQRGVTALQQPAEYVQWLSAEQASRRAGLALRRGGLLFAAAGWVEPAVLCRALLADLPLPPPLWNQAVARVGHDGQRWTALDARGQILACADQLVVCTGAGPLPWAMADEGGSRLALAAPQHRSRAEEPAGSPRLRDQRSDFLGEELRTLQRLRGEITGFADGALRALDLVLCGEGYLIPTALGASVGATYDRSGPDQPTAAGTAANARRASHLIDCAIEPASAIDGRAAWRSVAADRLPVLGPDPTLPGLWHLRALASRGLLWSPLCAEWLACAMNGEPLPLARSQAALLAPTRAALQAAGQAGAV